MDTVGHKSNINLIRNQLRLEVLWGFKSGPEVNYESGEQIRTNVGGLLQMSPKLNTM